MARNWEEDFKRQNAGIPLGDTQNPITSNNTGTGALGWMKSIVQPANYSPSNPAGIVTSVGDALKRTSTGMAMDLPGISTANANTVQKQPQQNTVSPIPASGSLSNNSIDRYIPVRQITTKNSPFNEKEIKEMMSTGFFYHNPMMPKDPDIARQVWNNWNYNNAAKSNSSSGGGRSVSRKASVLPQQSTQPQGPVMAEGIPTTGYEDRPIIYGNGPGVVGPGNAVQYNPNDSMMGSELNRRALIDNQPGIPQNNVQTVNGSRVGLSSFTGDQGGGSSWNRVMPGQAPATTPAQHLQNAIDIVNNEMGAMTFPNAESRIKFYGDALNHALTAGGGMAHADISGKALVEGAKEHGKSAIGVANINAGPDWARVANTANLGARKQALEERTQKWNEDVYGTKNLQDRQALGINALITEAGKGTIAVDQLPGLIDTLRKAHAGEPVGPQLPQVGEEYKGHIYIGGDPKNPKSWKKK